MKTLIQIELYKLFRKWRTYIGFIAVAVLVLVVQIAIFFGGKEYIDFLTQSISNSFILSGNLLNGYFVGYLILQGLYIHIPFLIVLVGGDLLAGEATAGTYRLLLSRPVSRFQVVTSKFVAGFIYTNLLLLFLMILSLGLSLMLFGRGELLVIQRKLFILSADDVFWRFLMAYCFASISMTTVFILSFFFSSLVENAIGPIIATMSVIIVFMVLSVLPLDAFRFVKPFLFVTHMDNWNYFFANPVNYSRILNSILVLGAHDILLLLFTFLSFNKKDILS